MKKIFFFLTFLLISHTLLASLSKDLEIFYPSNSVIKGYKSGLLYYPVVIKNKNSKKAYDVIFSDDMNFFATFSIAPGVTKTCDLFYPVNVQSLNSKNYIHQMKISSEKKILDQFFLRFSYMEDDMKLLFLGEQLNKTYITDVFVDRFSLKTKEPGSAWEKKWLVYAMYDVVMLTKRDYESMSQEVRKMLDDYVVAGGNLILFGLPEYLNEMLENNQVINRPNPHFDKENNNQPRVFEKKQKEFNTLFFNQGYFTDVGLGSCTVFPEKFLPQNKQESEMLSIFLQYYLEDILKINKKPLTNLSKFEKFFPKKFFIFLIIFFSFLIGPLSLFVLGRKQCRIWMFITTPIISLVTIFIIMLVLLIGEGFSGKVNIREIILLNEITKKIVSQEFLVGYFPLGAFRPLVLDPNTEFIIENSAQSYKVNYANQLFIKNAFPSRIQSQINLRSVNYSDLRLEFFYEQGNLMVVNWFNKPIKSIAVVGKNGSYWTGENLYPGEKRKLTLSSMDNKLKLSNLELFEEKMSRNKFIFNYQWYFDYWLDRPGRYLIILEKNNTIQNRSILGASVQSESIILGTSADLQEKNK